LSKGEFGLNLIYNPKWLNKAGLLPAQIINRTQSQKLLPRLSADDLWSCSWPGTNFWLPVGQYLPLK